MVYLDNDYLLEFRDKIKNYNERSIFCDFACRQLFYDCWNKYDGNERIEMLDKYLNNQNIFIFTKFLINKFEMTKTGLDHCKYNTILEYLVLKIILVCDEIEKDFFDECFQNHFFIKVFLIKLSDIVLGSKPEIFKYYYKYFKNLKIENFHDYLYTHFLKRLYDKWKEISYYEGITYCLDDKVKFDNKRSKEIKKSIQNLYRIIDINDLKEKMRNNFYGIIDNEKDNKIVNGRNELLGKKTERIDDDVVVLINCDEDIKNKKLNKQKNEKGYINEDTKKLIGKIKSKGKKVKEIINLKKNNSVRKKNDCKINSKDIVKSKKPYKKNSINKKIENSNKARKVNKLKLNHNKSKIKKNLVKNIQTKSPTKYISEDDSKRLHKSRDTSIDLSDQRILRSLKNSPSSNIKPTLNINDRILSEEFKSTPSPKKSLRSNNVKYGIIGNNSPSQIITRNRKNSNEESPKVNKSPNKINSFMLSKESSKKSTPKQDIITPIKKKELSKSRSKDKFLKKKRILIQENNNQIKEFNPHTPAKEIGKAKISSVSHQKSNMKFQSKNK